MYICLHICMSEEGGSFVRNGAIFGYCTLIESIRESETRTPASRPPQHANTTRTHAHSTDLDAFIRNGGSRHDGTLKKETRRETENPPPPTHTHALTPPTRTFAYRTDLTAFIRNGATRHNGTLHKREREKERERHTHTLTFPTRTQHRPEHVYQKWCDLSRWHPPPPTHFARPL